MAQSSQIQSSDERYRDQVDTDPQSRFVQNATVNRGPKEQTLNSRPSEDGRRGRTSPRRYRGPQEQNDFVDEVSRRDQIVDKRYLYNPQQISESDNTNSAPQKKQVHTSLFARARGITFGIVTMSWLVPVYFFWQFPIAMVGAIMLGLSLQVETSYLLSAIDTAAQVTGSLFGFDYVNLTAIGMLAVVSAAAFGVVSACIAGATAIIWGLHPLSGNAAGAKTATFIVGVVGACIPFANMFPWIIFWVLVMMRHPK